MRKFITACFAVFLISSVSATTIHSEDVLIDLADQSVEVDLAVSDLTADRFTYLFNYPIEDVDVNIDGETADCKVNHLQIGSEISCDPPEEDKFNVHMEFSALGMMTERQEVRLFEYTQSFYRRTENFTLRVLLPRGSGLPNDENVSMSVIEPSGANTNSDGQRIFVEWKLDPSLGDPPVNFQIAYERFSTPINIYEGAGLALLAAVMSLAGYFFYRRMKQEDIENVYSELEGDEIEVLELLRENEGDMLQKDVVEELDYSKAKISGTVSGLVEEEVLVKEKAGRSNKLSISRGYRG